MGYNLKNAGNGKSISKTSKWLSLRVLALKNKLIRQLEFSENSEDIYWKMLLESKVSNNFFDTNLLCFFKFKLGHFDAFHMLFQFVVFFKLQSIIL